MNVIIAVVPAPGHERLVAEGPMGERPAVLVQTGDGHWIYGQHIGPFAGSDVVVRALVLHAPGDPRLGMVRLMEALFGRDADESDFSVDHGTGEAAMIDRNGDTLADWEIPPMPAAADGRAFAFAHLAVRCGIASEVLVLP